MNTWVDGLCIECGSTVIETSAGSEGDTSPEAMSNDYKNMCVNPKCSQHKWHYCGDQEQLNYYIHKRGTNK